MVPGSSVWSKNQEQSDCWSGLRLEPLNKVLKHSVVWAVISVQKVQVQQHLPESDPEFLCSGGFAAGLLFWTNKEGVQQPIREQLVPAERSALIGGNIIFTVYCLKY
ncbi:hypothetical protein AMECASPLE_019904 [Ameca splendens]|uniref:Uncharacterized protein n=1 Tax=Ameca splendens TaxID=208324 RepID=A0ABV0ZC92_9TELE